jgi:hypothetical protein
MECDDNLRRIHYTARNFVGFDTGKQTSNTLKSTISKGVSCFSSLAR